MKECNRRLFKNIDKSSREKINFKKILYSSLCVSRCEGVFLQLKSQLFINKLIEREKIIWDQLDQKMNIRFFVQSQLFCDLVYCKKFVQNLSAKLVCYVGGEERKSREMGCVA